MKLRDAKEKDDITRLLRTIIEPLTKSPVVVASAPSPTVAADKAPARPAIPEVAISQ
jgi:hypothetical protein